MPFIQKLTAIVVVVCFSAACSQKSATSPETVMGTDAPKTQTSLPSPFASSNDPQMTVPAQVTEKSAQALAYEQNIGDSLAGEACVVMLNIQTWLEEDRDKAVAQLGKVVRLSEEYRTLAQTYIADPEALRMFDAAMVSIAQTGESTLVALAALDLAGLMYIKDLIGIMQGADLAARESVGLPPKGPCV